MSAPLRSLLAGRPEVHEGYLFGSEARGEAGRGSDVDVAVYIEPSLAPGSEWLAVVVSGALAMPWHCVSDSPRRGPGTVYAGHAGP